MYHAFSVELARQYGVIEAILLENLRFWIEKNRRDGRHLHDGRYWTYHTIKEFAALFPYVSERKIQYSLQKLKQQGVLLAERFNQKGYDRTLWYTFTDFGASMIQN